MLFHLQESLKAVVLDEIQNDDDGSDDSSTSGETPAVIRIAAHAGVLLIEKYMDLTWDCEIYVISIGAFSISYYLKFLIADIYKPVMCPDRKLQWLKDHISSERLKEIKKMVISRWSKSYAPAQSQIPVVKKTSKVMYFLSHKLRYILTLDHRKSLNGLLPPLLQPLANILLTLFKHI